MLPKRLHDYVSELDKKLGCLPMIALCISLVAVAADAQVQRNLRKRQLKRSEQFHNALIIETERVIDDLKDMYEQLRPQASGRHAALQ